MSTKPMGSDSHNGTQPPETPSRCSGFFLFATTNGYCTIAVGFSFFATPTNKYLRVQRVLHTHGLIFPDHNIKGFGIPSGDAPFSFCET